MVVLGLGLLPSGVKTRGRGPFFGTVETVALRELAVADGVRAALVKRANCERTTLRTVSTVNVPSVPFLPFLRFLSRFLPYGFAP
jgi:hypothetical protein